MAKRLTENHPTYKKVYKLIQIMNELGLSIGIHQGGHSLMIIDADADADFGIRYADAEDGDDLYEFPSPFEHKLLVDEF